MPRQVPWPWCSTLTLLAGLLLAGCASHEQKMASRVEWYLEANRHYEALDYLEGYLDRYPTSERAWRYRVNIRLALDQRAEAGAEYWRLHTALGVHHLDALERIVLGGGGGWTLLEYPAMARCGLGGTGDLAFFEQTLLGHPIGQDADIVLTPPTETVLGVMKALPGRFGPDALPLIEEGLGHGSEEVRLAAGRALLRTPPGERDDGLLRRAFRDPSPRVRRGMVEAAITTWDLDLWAAVPIGEGEDDPEVAVAWLGLIGPAEPQREAALRAEVAAVAPVAAALSGIPEEAPPARGDPRLQLAIALGAGQCDERCWSRAAVQTRREITTLAAPFVPLPDDILARMAADADAVVRTAAARYLVHDAAHPALAPLIADPEQGVRAAAAAAMVASARPEATGPLLAYLGTAGLEEKLSLADALLQAPDHPFGEVAVALARDATSLVRENALPAVAAMCADEHEALFLEGLTDEDPHVVVRAAAGLYLVAARVAATPTATAAATPGADQEE